MASLPEDTPDLEEATEDSPDVKEVTKDTSNVREATEDTPDVEKARAVTSKDHHSYSCTQNSDDLTETSEELHEGRKNPDGYKELVQDELTERISQEEAQKLEALSREKLIEIHALMFQLANSTSRTRFPLLRHILPDRRLHDASTVHGINEIDFLAELENENAQRDQYLCQKSPQMPFMPGHARDDTSTEEEGNVRRRFLSTQAMMQDILEFCDMTLNDETNLCQRLSDLNAAVAALLAAIRDIGSPNFAAATQAITLIVCRLPDANEIPPQVRHELHSDVAALRAAVLQIAKSILHGEDVQPAIEQYTQVMHKLTFVLDNSENRETIELSDTFVITAYKETVDLLTLVHSVAAECGGRGEETLVAEGTEAINAAQALLNAVQITAPTIHTPQCKRVVFQLATDLTFVLDNVVKTAIAVTVSPEEYQQKLEEIKMAAAKNVQFLIVTVQSEGVSSTEKVRKRKKIQKTFYDHKLWLNSIAKKAYEDIMELVMLVYEVAATRGGEAEAGLHQRATTVTNQAQELFITAQLFAFTSNAGKFKHQVHQFIQDLAPALEDIVQAMFDGWTAPDERVGKQAEELKEVVDRSLQFLLDVQDRFEGEDPTLSAKQDEIEEDIIDSNVDKAKLIESAKKANEEIEVLLTIIQVTALWQDDTELTSEGSGTAHLAQELLNSVQLTITTNHAAKCKRVVQLLATYLMSALGNLIVLMSTTLRDDYRTQVEERKRMADKYLISLLDAVKDPKIPLNAEQNKELTQGLLHVENLQNLHLETYGYPEKARKLRIIFNEANGSFSNNDEYSAVQQLVTDIFSGTRTWGSGGKSLKDMLSTFCTVLNSPMELSSETDFSQPLWQRVQCLNAAFAGLLAAVRDSQTPNYVAANQAMMNLTKLLPDLVIDIKYMWTDFIQQGVRQDSLKLTYKFCSVIRSFLLNIDNEKDTYQLSEMYSEASSGLMSVFYKLEKKEPSIIVRNMRYEVGSACRATVALLAHAFSVAARGVGVGEGGGCGLYLKATRAAVAVQELLTSAQLTAVTTPSSVCKELVIQNVQELSFALRMLDQEWFAGAQEDIVKYSKLKGTAENELDTLLKSLALKIDAAPKTENNFQNRHLNLCLHLYNAEQTIKKAEMDVVKISPTISVESIVDKALAASIGDQIKLLNAAVVVLNRLNKTHQDYNFRFIESQDNHERAVSCLNAIQLLIPQIISGLNQDKSYKLVYLKENLPLILSAILSFIESLRLKRNEAQDAVVQYVKAACEVMSVYLPSMTTEPWENGKRLLIQANTVFRLASLVTTRVSSDKWSMDHDAVIKQAELAMKVADTFLRTAQRSFLGLEHQSAEVALRVATGDLSDAISALDQLCHQREYDADYPQQELMEFHAAVDRLLPMLELLDDVHTEHY